MGARSILFAWVLAACAASATAASAGERCEVGKIAEFPTTMVGLRPEVTVKIDGDDSTFMADSGAFYSFMNRAAVKRLKLDSQPAPIGFYVKGVGGSDNRVDIVRVHRFGLAGMDLPNVPFLVLPEIGGSTAGVLGQNVLSVFDTEYDLKNGYIRLMKPSADCRRAMLAYWAGSQAVGVVDLEPISPQQPHLRGKATLEGKSIRVTFDTGAPTSILKRSTAERLGFRPEAEAVRAAGVAGGIGQRRLETWIAPFESLELGGETIRHTRIRVSAIDLPQSDMLLGADFFLSHRIYVSKQQHRLYFTYNGGPVFNLGQVSTGAASTAGGGPGEQPAAAGGQYADVPTDAAGFARRGQASLSRRDFAAALADFDKATQLDPKEPGYFRDRAQAHLGLRQPVLAMADLDETLKLDPDDAGAHLGRGELYLAAHDIARAQGDFDAAVRARPDVALVVGAAYSAAGRFEQAVASYDGWIAANERNENLYQGLNGRCWARALSGHDLDKAIADCDLAVRRGPHIAALFDSRGLAHLRRGELDLAIADYNEALKLQPKLAWSLYGRGLAKIGAGDKAGGAADLQAASAIAPNLPATAKRYGVVAAAATQRAAKNRAPVQ